MGGPPVLAPARCPSVVLLLLSTVVLALLLGSSWTGRDLSGVRVLTDWPVGDGVASLVTEGGVEQSGSI